MDETLVTSIRKQFLQVLEQVHEATIRSGRDVNSVRLMVVSKSQPLDVVRAAIAAGASILGENYAEEAVSKITALRGTEVEWHMIGHVQSRKADLLPGNFAMFHALDSLKLANRLDRFCALSGCKLPVLLEVNVSNEESKFGFPAWDEQNWIRLLPVFEEILSIPTLSVRGLMTMPPFFDDPEQARPYFQRLRQLQEFLQDRLTQTDWADLSMGTSADYRIAIEEGATYVRVGQAILGPRR